MTIAQELLERNQSGHQNQQGSYNTLYVVDIMLKGRNGLPVHMQAITSKK